MIMYKNNLNELYKPTLLQGPYRTLNRHKRLSKRFLYSFLGGFATLRLTSALNFKRGWDRFEHDESSERAQSAQDKTREREK